MSQTNFLIVGESLNGTIPSVGKAIIERDEAFIASLAQKQAECGAQRLDICAQLGSRNQMEDLIWLLEIVQREVDLPLVIDSADLEVLRLAPGLCKTRPVLSSINGEHERLEKLLPVAVESGCDLVALCMDDNGVPETAEGRLQIAASLLDKAVAAGMRPEQLYFDVMVISVGTDDQAALTTIETTRLIRQNLPGVHTYSGLSNVGFGLPNRRILNRAFLPMLAAAGMDTFLIDVRDEALMVALYASRVLTGNDRYCKQYLKAHRAGKLG